MDNATPKATTRLDSVFLGAIYQVALESRIFGFQGDHEVSHRLAMSYNRARTPSIGHETNLRSWGVIVAVEEDRI